MYIGYGSKIINVHKLSTNEWHYFGVKLPRWGGRGHGARLIVRHFINNGKILLEVLLLPRNY